MHVPQKHEKYRIPLLQFQESIPNYNLEIAQIIAATAVESITNPNSWKPEASAADIEGDWLKLVATELQRNSHRFQAVYLVLQRATNRL